MQQHTILLIEANTSLRRMIALGLQYRGMRVLEASSPTALPAIEALGPGLVVLDIDGEAGSDRSLLARAQAHPYLSTLPMVVLAWDCLVPAGMALDTLQQPVTCLTKPFDARTLHTTVEQILAATEELTPSLKQEMLLAARSQGAAPSICPLVTAAGLLLLFIGLMTQVIVSGLGLLIVIFTLLCWTLGTKAEPETLLLEAR